MEPPPERLLLKQAATQPQDRRRNYHRWRPQLREPAQR